MKENGIKIEHINDNWSGCPIYVELPLTEEDLRNKIRAHEAKTKIVGDRELNLIEVCPNAYDFFAKQLKADEYHEAGYLWASRCSVMNYHFGVNLIDVNAYRVDNHSTPIAIGIDVSVIKEILPDKYVIMKHVYEHDIRYFVTFKSCVEHFEKEGNVLLQ